MVKLEKLGMFRSFGRVELNTNDVVILAEVRRRWIGFFPQVGKVEIGPNLAYQDALIEDLIMNGMDGHYNMFDTRCNCPGLEDVDARLAVFINWQRANVVVVEAEEFRHILKEDAFLNS